jgi:hypothetical protein
LEHLQDKRREQDNSFSYTKEDLRVPLEFYKLRYLNAASAAQEVAIVEAYSALFTDNATGFRAAAEKAGVRVSATDLKPLLRKQGA